MVFIYLRLVLAKINIVKNYYIQNCNTFSGTKVHWASINYSAKTLCLNHTLNKRDPSIKCQCHNKTNVLIQCVDATLLQWDIETPGDITQQQDSSYHSRSVFTFRVNTLFFCQSILATRGPCLHRTSSAPPFHCWFTGKRVVSRPLHWIMSHCRRCCSVNA